MQALHRLLISCVEMCATQVGIMGVQVEALLKHVKGLSWTVRGRSQFPAFAHVVRMLLGALRITLRALHTPFLLCLLICVYVMQFTHPLQSSCATCDR